MLFQDFGFVKLTLNLCTPLHNGQVRIALSGTFPTVELPAANATGAGAAAAANPPGVKYNVSLAYSTCSGKGRRRCMLNTAG